MDLRLVSTAPIRVKQGVGHGFDRGFSGEIQIVRASKSSQFRWQILAISGSP